MDEQRWKAEEYRATFENAMGVILQFFNAMNQYMAIKTNQNVLEIGIGSGKWSAAFSIVGCNVVAVDNNLEILDNFHVNFPQISKAILTVQDDATTLRKIPNKTFDIVFSEGLLEHFLDFEERQKVILNMFSKVRPNGICVCLVPKNSVKDDEILYSSPEQLISEFERINGFEKIEGFTLEASNIESKLNFVAVCARRGIE